MDAKTRKAVKKAYLTSRNSIQDIARIYRVDVHEVMEVIGEGQASTVHLEGDMISQDEAGSNAQMNYGKDIKIPINPN